MDDFTIDDKLFFKEHVRAYYRIARALDTANLFIFMKAMGRAMAIQNTDEVLRIIGENIGGKL